MTMNGMSGERLAELRKRRDKILDFWKGDRPLGSSREFVDAVDEIERLLTELARVQEVEQLRIRVLNDTIDLVAQQRDTAYDALAATEVQVKRAMNMLKRIADDCYAIFDAEGNDYLAEVIELIDMRNDG